MPTNDQRDPRLEFWNAHFDSFPFYRFLDLSVEEARPGFARLSMPTSERTQGGVQGSVHGGILAALVDVAMLRALIPMFEPQDEPGGTVDLGITFLRPALGTRVTVEATVLRKGRQLASSEVSILDDGGRLCARGRVLYAFRAAKP
jgi:uncharacterized protein (TIGR00369 family)